MSNETKEAHSTATGTGGTKVLIIYYSLTGNTKSIAEKIREKTRGDVFEIETVRTYPPEYSALTEEAKRELQTGDLPALKKSPPDMSAYDLILVGSPVWWYTVSTPVMGFLTQADFGARKFPPFVPTREGSGDYSRISRSRPKMPLSLKVSTYTSRGKPGKARWIKLSTPGSASCEKNSVLRQSSVKTMRSGFHTKWFGPKHL